VQLSLLYRVYCVCVLSMGMLSMLSSDADTTTLGVHARGHVHGRKLLEHELGGVWDDDLCDLGLVLARSALELVLLERAESALVNVFIDISGEQNTLTQWESSDRKSRKHGHGKHPKHQAISPLRKQRHRERSYNRAPSLRNADHHHVLYLPRVDGSRSG
jgi:hypothetical protein